MVTPAGSQNHDSAATLRRGARRPLPLGVKSVPNYPGFWYIYPDGVSSRGYLHESDVDDDGNAFCVRSWTLPPCHAVFRLVSGRCKIATSRSLLAWSCRNLRMRSACDSLRIGTSPL